MKSASQPGSGGTGTERLQGLRLGGLELKPGSGKEGGRVSYLKGMCVRSGEQHRGGCLSALVKSGYNVHMFSKAFCEPGDVFAW